LVAFALPVVAGAVLEEVPVPGVFTVALSVVLELLVAGVVAAVLPGAVVSVEAVLGVVVVVVLDGGAVVVVVVELVVLVRGLSQPAIAPEARARAATRGIIFFMTSPVVRVCGNGTKGEHAQPVPARPAKRRGILGAVTSSQGTVGWVAPKRLAPRARRWSRCTAPSRAACSRP
jgi:hypothetical protein